MEPVPPGPDDGRPEPVSRCRMLQLTGGVGAAASVNACSKSVTPSAAQPSPSPADPAAPDNRNSPARLRQHQLRTPALACDTATDDDTTGHFLVVCEGDFGSEAAEIVAAIEAGH